MTMHINLSPEMEGFTKAQVSSGFYGNATEVIRDAVRRMQAEEGRRAAWKAAVAKGDAELDRGEGIPYNADTLANISQSANKTMDSDLPMDPDVLP
jgi:antitoxin ParD1/3/4